MSTSLFSTSVCSSERGTDMQNQHRKLPIEVSETKESLQSVRFEGPQTPRQTRSGQQLPILQRLVFDKLLQIMGVPSVHRVSIYRHQELLSFQFENFVQVSFPPVNHALPD